MKSTNYTTRDGKLFSDCTFIYLADVTEVKRYATGSLDLIGGLLSRRDGDELSTLIETIGVSEVFASELVAWAYVKAAYDKICDLYQEQQNLRLEIQKTINRKLSGLEQEASPYFPAQLQRTRSTETIGKVRI